MTADERSTGNDALANRLAEVIDDSALTHSGRSIGVLASHSVAIEVLAFLRESAVIPPAKGDR